jgi:hypothetical protein
VVKRLIILSIILVLLLTGCAQSLKYGFAREVSTEEQTLRLSLVQAAEGWLGCKEADGTHKPIIDLYNAHEPLAQGYTVKYTDQWCATFVSAAAITAELTDIIPTECGCQRQIGLFEQLDCWEEKDNYVPLPGDIIFYATTASGIGDCTDWSDHVGIVVGTNGNRIKVIEGNNGEAVRYRYLYTTDPTIRGYGLPDYASKT